MVLNNNILAKSVFCIFILFITSSISLQSKYYTKTAIIDLQYAHSAAHIQIGKQYPYMRGRGEQNLDFLNVLKQELDPDNILNPGALGFKA